MTRNRFSRDLSSFLRKNFSFQFLAISTILFGLNSCYNEPNMIGGGLIPGDDTTAICVTDTFKVSAYTVRPDSISTSYFNYAVLGCNNSDIFGKIKADFMTEFSIDNLKDTFYTIKNPRPIDSVMLKMKLDRPWGKNNHSINVRVYQVARDIYDANTPTKLYINGNKDIKSSDYVPIEVGEPTVYSGGDSLKIKFKPEFVNFLKSLPDTAFRSNTALQKYFKGLYITSDDYSGNDGALYFFKTELTNTRLLIYHKRPAIRNHVSVIVDTVFRFNSSPSPKFNHYFHDNTTAEEALKINHFYDYSESAVNVEDSVFYVDGLGGHRGIIKFSSAEAWKKLMPIAIHKAELRIELQTLVLPDDSIADPGSLLYYYKREYSEYNTINSDDLTKILDYNLTSTNSVSFNKAKQYYSFDVTIQLQNILKNKVKNDYIFIEPTDFKNSYLQRIFRSGNNSRPIKLIITYSKL